MGYPEWEKEFYPEPAIEAADKGTLAAIDNSLRKWQGMTDENLAKHGLERDRNQIVPAGTLQAEREGKWTGVSSVSMGSNNCALCWIYQASTGPLGRNVGCGGCPLIGNGNWKMALLGHRNDGKGMNMGIGNGEQDNVVNMPQGFKQHPPGSREKFGKLRIWAKRRAEIQARYDPVAGYRALGDIGRQAAQVTQDRAIQELAVYIQWVWESELGRLWQWADKVDKRLLIQQLDDLALIQADDCRQGSGKWQALEGVMGMLGGLRDWLEGREG